MQFTITVDGPAAAGKGTLSRALAAHFGFEYLDTGLLYRAVGAKVRDGQEPVCAARSLAPEDLVRGDLRSAEIGQYASKVSAIPEVRSALLDYQKSFARRDGGAVLDGRSLAYEVAPDADIKLYVTASNAERAKRRHKELQAAGSPLTLDEVARDLAMRDERDAGRATFPMKPAPDGIILDTSEKTIDEVLASVISLVSMRRGSL